MNVTEKGVRSALRRLLPTVAASPSVQGLGIPDLFLRGLRQRFYLDWVPSDVPADLGFQELPDSSKATVQRLATYARCLKHECMMTELGDERDEELLDRIAGLLIGVERFFDKSHPKIAVYQQGFEPFNAAIREVATSRNIPVLGLEITAFRDRFCWDFVSGITRNALCARAAFTRIRSQLDPDLARAYCDRMIKNTVSLKHSEHSSPSTPTPEQYGDGYILFLGQVYTDASVVYGLNNWKSPVQVVETLAQSALSIGRRLVIKLHPKEQSGLTPFTLKPYENLTYRRLLENEALRKIIAEGKHVSVDVHNAYSTYDLMSRASCAVTLTSQAGLEATVRGLRTVVCGETFYSGLGLAWEAKQTSEMRDALAECLSSGQSEVLERQREAELFTYYYFERFCKRTDAGNFYSLVRSAMSSGAHLA